ncbi:lipase family protein [Streptacidiphilus fuscans]|uniref:Triacylglycerol lipase n=1 Tax=Streptacidiphilus fuscans TaxID=2789292 RepID=A0A931FCT2_9ACTN|nr:lipase family protein [Streptacidiphilus fuscans]MBF9066816.1 triacylglycerol lipase [Streptacidiphilus fuscans]
MSRHAARLLATAVAAVMTAAVAPAATAEAAAAPTASTASTPSVGAAVAAHAVRTAAADDSFYSYDGSTPLGSFAPGTVLKERTLQYHLLGIPTPLQVIQLLYRTVDAQGRPTANVTSVVRSLTGDRTRAVSYQSFYDSLDPADSPSRAIAGDVTLGGVIPNAEAVLLVPLLLQGYNLVIPDTEGQTADFAAGPEYGATTLDSIRAATRAEGTGLDADTRFGLMGYSGGAIATDWAAAMAPTYAPEVNRKLVGFAEGGLLVDPAHNLKYVDGSLVWSGVIPMALIGVARSYGLDLEQYMSPYGQKVYNDLQNASIVDALGHYPGLTWKQMAKPQYADPDSVPAFVGAVNRINLGSAGTPTVPGFIGQGDGGVFEGTFSNVAGIGTGDGVMVAGDVRALARQYCATGDPAIKFQQYDLLSHVGTAVAWAPTAIGWLADRFAGRTAPSDCGSIPAGNSLAPEVPTS